MEAQGYMISTAELANFYLAMTVSPLVILSGISGTGKSLLAKWLHQQGARAEEPFVDLNCAGLSSEFLETELFGHEKGAFTGAVAPKQGLLEVADGGTVFLDEIGDMDPRVQPKLLKALEEKRFRRMGAVREREVDIALIAATHKNLAEQVRQGLFRSDLYFRINSIALTVPALRERKEDIPLLAKALLSQLFHPGCQATLSSAAVQALCNHDWPGNVRELRNALERAALFCENGTITPRDLGLGCAAVQQAPSQNSNLTLEEVERQYIERIVREESGKVAQAALRLNIPRSTLYQKIKTYGIQVPQNAGV